MANPQTEFYDGTLPGNILVLGSSGNGKTSPVQDIASNSMFGKLEGIYWVSGINLSKKREGEIESCFESKVDFYYPSDEHKLSKTFSDFENIYREKGQSKSSFEGSGKGELVKRDNLIVLDDVTGLANKSPSFIKFLTVCRKFGYSMVYIFHEPATSSWRWRDIMSQMQIFCVFPFEFGLCDQFPCEICRKG